ncbi:hypothetical protein WMY93_004882 [Mugilogobius chulae]|uniref:Uncharacterized protein n=1 Tax=Mugilogobius chulae TaxID=88201 RepID=A0AAW0Q0I5_9GOBI
MRPSGKRIVFEAKGDWNNASVYSVATGSRRDGARVMYGTSPSEAGRFRTNAEQTSYCLRDFCRKHRSHSNVPLSLDLVPWLWSVYARSGLWKRALVCVRALWPVEARSGLWKRALACGSALWPVEVRSGLCNVALACGSALWGGSRSCESCPSARGHYQSTVSELPHQLVLTQKEWCVQARDMRRTANLTLTWASMSTSVKRAGTDVTDSSGFVWMFE